VIFVTVGTQLAFDRLVGAVDSWAGSASSRPEIFAQIGPSDLQPRNIDYARFVSPDECLRHMRSADAIVAHAGIGTILTALEMGKPLLVMPRKASLGEHRNDHQMATVSRFATGAIDVAPNEIELARRLDRLGERVASPRISSSAPPEFLEKLAACIRGEHQLMMPLTPAAPRRTSRVMVELAGRDSRERA
jgi:UDP-N-acetylglucosamine transferase subunit ALG13